MQRFLLLGGVVALVFAVSFGPFVLAGQLEQVLFPQNFCETEQLALACILLLTVVPSGLSSQC